MSLIEHNPWALGIGREAEVTVASDAITPYLSFHSVDTEGDAATDDLSTINGGFDNAVLVLRLEHPDRQVVLKHNVGNLLLPSGVDVTLNPTTKQYQVLWYSATLGKWLGLESAYYILLDRFAD